MDRQINGQIDRQTDKQMFSYIDKQIKNEYILTL